MPGLVRRLAVGGREQFARVVRGERILAAAEFAGHIELAVFLQMRLDFRLADWDWRSRYPKLAAWYAEAAKRPSMQATQPA